MSQPPRRILLADADAFFVAVARMEDPQGVGREPLLIVGGTRESRGVVCSASYETRAYGVRSAMPIAQALRLCPAAVCVPVPRKACAQKSGEIREVLERFSPVVEPASIDEWYLDLAGTEALYRQEPLAETARRMREMIARDTGLHVSFGGGTSKLVAKLAVERAKPKPDSGATGVFVVAPGAEAEFLRGIALAEIPMIGPRFQERLARFGMRTVPDVLQYEVETLVQWLGAREAHWLYDRARGMDAREVAPRLDAKSISRDETFPQDLADDASLNQELLALVTRAAADLRGEGLRARTVTVRIRDHDFRNRSASRTMEQGVMSDRVLLAQARHLLSRLRAGRRVPARLLGVALSGLAEDETADQLALFEGERDPAVETARDRAVARAVDQVRAKFGPRGIGPGGV
ncbi:MAG TPA: DNA polymerase IV [Gemmatimonadaceae bacterium]|nr:DNA polymerase IV [Gemmatimonadaceae bacterium]